MPIFPELFDRWSNGAPLIELISSGDFATWANGAPVLEFQTGVLSLITSDTLTPTDGVTVSLQLLITPPPPPIIGGGIFDGRIPSTLWRPAWLIDLSEVSLPVGYTPDQMHFAPIDIDSLTPPHYGRIVDLPTIERQVADIFWGISDITEIEFTLVNTDGFLTNLHTLVDIREDPVKLQRYDLTTGILADTVYGRVESTGLEDGKFILRVSSVSRALAEQLVPSVLITETNFPLAVDLQTAIPVVFGNAIKISLPYIKDGVLTDEFEYMIGHGTDLTINQLYRAGVNNVMIEIHPEEYTIDTATYPGYTIVRFALRQVDLSDAFYKLYGDISWTSRNFADAIRAVLTNTVWGLGQTVDDDSFDAAAAVLSSLGLYCDGVLNSQTQAQDVFRQLLIVRGMRLGFNETGDWKLTVDQKPEFISLVAAGGPDIDGARTIITAGPRSRSSAINKVSVYTLKYAPDFTKNGDTTKTHTRRVNARGKAKNFEALIIRDDTTADMVCDYLAKREYYGQDTGEFELSQEAQQLIEGALIQLYYPPTGYYGELVEVQKLSKTLETVRATVAAWSEQIYVYQPGDTT